MDASRGPALEVWVDALDVWGRHGVLPEEKSQAQRFRIDLRLTLLECRGAVSDSLADTVDYAAVIRLVTTIVEELSFELLERLAYVLAEAVLAGFPSVHSVQVQVSKPEPPIARPLGAVGVSLELSRAAAE